MKRFSAERDKKTPRRLSLRSLRRADAATLSTLQGGDTGLLIEDETLRGDGDEHEADEEEDEDAEEEDAETL